MQKNFSVLALLLKLKMKWTLITLACTAALGVGAYYVLVLMHGEAPTFQFGGSNIVFTIVFAAGSFFTALICSGILSGRSRERYLMARLQISERKVFVWETVASSLYMLLLWMVEIITLGSAGLIHNASKLNQGGSQDVVFAIYRNSLFRGIIPMDGAALLHGLFCIVCGGVACACIAMYTGDSASRGIGIIALVLASVSFMVGWNLITAFFTGLSMVIAIVLAVKRLHSGKERTEDEEEDI